VRVNILGGYAKNFTIFLKEAKGLRPTLALLKRRFFDAYQDFAGIHFYDLCAGSGVMGLEALSRGASAVAFFETHRQTFSTLQSTVALFSERYADELSDKSISLVNSAFAAHCLPEMDQNCECIFYLDPPYERRDLYLKLVGLLFDSGCSGKLCLESDERKGWPSEELETYLKQKKKKIERIFKQGCSYLAIIDLQGDD